MYESGSVLWCAVGKLSTFCMHTIVLAAPQLCRLSALCQAWFHLDPKHVVGCTSFGNPGIDFIINVHDSWQCASKVDEFFYYLQSLTFHCNGGLLVRLARCWLINHLGLFDADCEVIAVTGVRYLIYTFLHLLFCWSTLCQQSGPSCWKLTMSLVNVSLKFTSSDTQICWNFLLKKCEKLSQCKSYSNFFSKKYQNIVYWIH